MRIPKIETKKLKEFFKILPKKICQKAFLTFFLLFLVFLILGFFIYYRYSILEKESEIIEKPLQFKEAVFQKIFKEWQIRQEKFEQAEFKEYPNLFSPLIPEETTPEELTE